MQLLTPVPASSQMWNTLGMNLASLPVAGSSRHRPAWIISSSSTPSSPALLLQCALLLSQGGPFSGLPFTVFPLPFTSVSFRCSFAFFSSVVFVFLFLSAAPFASSSALLPVWPTSLATTVQRARLLGCLEDADSRWRLLRHAFCREAGARVSTNIFVRDLDLAPLGGVDGRRLEVVTEGLPVFHGTQLAIGTTPVSPLRVDGVPHRQCHL